MAAYGAVTTDQIALAAAQQAALQGGEAATTSGDTHPAEHASGDLHPAEGVREDAEGASGDILAEYITWLRESLAGEKDASRRSDAETLLSVASKLSKQPSKNALRQIAKELEVHQKDRRMNEIYDAALARVGDRVDELPLLGSIPKMWSGQGKDKKPVTHL